MSADISGLFDNIDHGHLRDMIKRKMNDGKILRLIGKWLNAGVMDAGQVTYPDKGTPQGGVISPILSNIFLHYVLDDWFVKEAKSRMKGRTLIIRLADDFIIGCEYEEDARRLLEVVPKRFARFGLELHPEKTILVSFSNRMREICSSGSVEDASGNRCVYPEPRTSNNLLSSVSRTQIKRLFCFTTLPKICSGFLCL